MKRLRRSPRRGKKLASEEQALVAANACLDMKAEDIVVLRVAELTAYADFLVITSGRSTRQAQSIAERVQRAIAAAGSRPVGIEGEREGNWILVDWGAVIVHVFYAPVREFYDLEKLWGDAPRLTFPGPHARK
ncbi:MAG TPA: ribosome silencing factor [bacterium]|nr:ribosome silencing factor [bacterium]